MAENGENTRGLGLSSVVYPIPNVAAKYVARSNERKENNHRYPFRNPLDEAWKRN
jgi:hypothetical protein